MIDFSVLLGLEQLIDDPGCVAEGFGFDSTSTQRAEPEIAERSLFLFHHEMTTLLEASASAGDQGRAIVEAVLAAEIAAERQSNVIQKR